MYLQRSRGETVFTVFNIAFLIVLSLTFVIPFLSIISTSLLGIEEWARRGAFILFPQKIEFGAYQILFTGGSRLATGFFYSLARILIGTAGTVARSDGVPARRCPFRYGKDGQGCRRASQAFRQHYLIWTQVEFVRQIGHISIKRLNSTHSDDFLFGEQKGLLRVGAVNGTGDYDMARTRRERGLRHGNGRWWLMGG